MFAYAKFLFCVVRPSAYSYLEIPFGLREFWLSWCDARADERLAQERQQHGIVTSLFDSLARNANGLPYISSQHRLLRGGHKRNISLRRESAGLVEILLAGIQVIQQRQKHAALVVQVRRIWQVIQSQVQYLQANRVFLLRHACVRHK